MPRKGMGPGFWPMLPVVPRAQLQAVAGGGLAIESHKLAR